MKILYVGDPHIVKDCIEEGEKLIDYVVQVSFKEQVDKIVILGDGFNNHATINASVALFWENAFSRLSVAATHGMHYVLGNHDYDPNNRKAHALRRYNYIGLVDEWERNDGILYVAHTFDQDKFIKICNQMSQTSTVVCHQTFSGSKYENGFFAKDGINPDLIPQKHIISGHIHAHQKFGKVFYPGAPRWITVSDANTEKFIWVIEHDNNGVIISKKAFYTNEVCTPIYHINDSVDHLFVPDEKHRKAKVTVDISGDVAFCKERKEYFSNMGFKIRTYPTRNTISQIRESMGPKMALSKFLDNYVPPNRTDKNRLLELIKSRVSWAN